jgi:hypothetical protein
MMPQNTIYTLWRKKAVYKPLPADLLDMEITQPTVVAVGSGVYYGYHITDYGGSHSKVQLRISDTDKFEDRRSTYNDYIKDFNRTDPAYLTYVPYGEPPNPDWVVPPYGQPIVPFSIGLSVLSIPNGMKITIWYTVPGTPLGEEARQPLRRPEQGYPPLRPWYRRIRVF